MSMGGSVRLRRNTVRLVSDHCPACVGLLSGIDRKPCPPSPECANSNGRSASFVDMAPLNVIRRAMLRRQLGAPACPAPHDVLGEIFDLARWQKWVKDRLRTQFLRSAIRVRTSFDSGHGIDRLVQLRLRAEVREQFVIARAVNRTYALSRGPGATACRPQESHSASYSWSWRGPCSHH